MLNKKLLRFDPGAMCYVMCNVLCQWLALLCNVAFVLALTHILWSAFSGAAVKALFAPCIAICLVTIPLRWVCATCAAAMSHKASENVKGTLRSRIYEKILELGSAYSETVATSEVVMLASEGVEQIDTYFARYLPQLFYSLLAPVTLFCILAPIHLRSAVVLLVCVPLIPLSIVAVQKFAKRLLARYWGEYTALGDSFLEHIQGLTTLKIYRSDGWKHRQMNEQAEHFRKITMKVLTMQLNSVTLMDLLAYGGAALGCISAVAAFAAGNIGLVACLTIVLLAADFFLPLRLLGLYFHIAMNGAASAEKIFRLLETPAAPDGTQTANPGNVALAVEHVTFGYGGGRTILQDVSMEFPQGSFTALVGESGCGKSTLAGLLSGQLNSDAGAVTLDGIPAVCLSRRSRMETITLVPHDAVLFKGTVESNLRMAAPHAAETTLWAALEQVNLAGFCRSQQGLATPVQEGGSNLSGGQRQRLAMARVLLPKTSALPTAKKPSCRLFRSRSRISRSWASPAKAEAENPHSCAC